MTPRERTMALLLVTGIVLGGGALLGYLFVYSPLQDKWNDSARLQSEIDEMDGKLLALNKLRPRITEARRQSLPPDVPRATLQYQQLLEYLRPAGLRSQTDYTVKFSKPLPNTTNATPTLAPKKPAYQRLEFTVDINHAHVWQVVDFLGRFYQLDLLHQITELKITRSNKPSELRNELDVSIRIEAIVLDGIEPRSTLFPVTNAVAAVGGFPSLAGLANRPDVVRHLSPTVTTPVLATRGRDYSLIPKYDIFYGELPPPVSGPPFTVGRIEDVVINKPEEPTTVKFSLTGRGSENATVTATVKSGSLFDVGPLEVDLKSRTIKLPRVSEELGSSADALVTVVATSSDGVVETRRFEVAMGKPTTRVVETKTGPDIAGVIKLVGITGLHVGDETTVTALIWDQANPFEYRIAVGTKGIRVSKLIQTPVPKARPPRMEFAVAEAYAKANPADVLALSDEWSGTKRTFRVIALEPEAVVLVELVAAEPDAKQPGGKGKFPIGGGRNPQKGNLLAVVAGNPAAAVAPPPPPPPTKPGAYYRWPLGKSLKEVLDPKAENKHRLSAEEAKKILQRVAEVGPLASSGPTSGN
jgi:hypothetical protein